MSRFVWTILFLLFCGLMPFSVQLAFYAVAGANPPTDYSFSDAEASSAAYKNVITGGY
ncbi:MAG TPA: hypothetical protein VGV18_09300 [Verrucomicrobiae bacterium]|nr:hypothetical protein [Verrucomicrobiae bacterium]